MAMIDRFRHGRRLIIGVFILLAVIFTVFILLMPSVLKPRLYYQRGSFRVSKDGVTTYCIVENQGRASAEDTRMKVVFLSRILNVEFFPESAGSVMEFSDDQHNAMLELRDIAPKEQITVEFTVEQSQDKPFDIYLLDLGGGVTDIRERVFPIK